MFDTNKIETAINLLALAKVNATVANNEFRNDERKAMYLQIASEYALKATELLAVAHNETCNARLS